jgi:hypothetical protein
MKWFLRVFNHQILRLGFSVYSQNFRRIYLKFCTSYLVWLSIAWDDFQSLQTSSSYGGLPFWLQTTIPIKKHTSQVPTWDRCFFTIFLRLKIWWNLSKILAKLVEIYGRKKKPIYLSKNSEILPEKEKENTAWDKEKEIKGYNDLHSHPVCRTARKKYFLRLAFLLHNHILCMQLNFCVFSQKVSMGWWLSRGFNAFFFVVF